MVEAVQLNLIRLGYFEVGEVDGKVGTRTRGALLAFLADNGLPLDMGITAETLSLLEDGRPRAVATDRLSGKPKDSTIIDASNKSAAVGGVSAGIGILTAAGPILEQVEQGSGLASRLRSALEPFGDLVGEAWPFILIAAGLAVVVFALRARRARVRDYRIGKTPT